MVGSIQWEEVWHLNICKNIYTRKSATGQSSIYPFWLTGLLLGPTGVLLKSGLQCTLEFKPNLNLQYTNQQSSQRFISIQLIDLPCIYLFITCIQFCLALRSDKFGFVFTDNSLCECLVVVFQMSPDGC